MSTPVTPYIFYAQWQGPDIFAQNTQTGSLTGLEFSQNFYGPIQVQVRDLSGNIVDMTGWTCYVGIVGYPGSPSGVAVGVPLAEYTTAFNYVTPIFSGTMDCRTMQMATLIGAKLTQRTRFAIKFIKEDLTQEFECSCDCTMIAHHIVDGATAIVSLGPIAFTVAAGTPQITFTFPNVPAGANLTFVKLNSGPVVDYYVVNVNPDNPALNTVTVTLQGNAPLGGSNFTAYVLNS